MSENNVHFYDFGEFRLDLVNFRLLSDGETVPLTQKSFELLHHLIENRSRVLKKEELLNDLWEGSFVEEANLTQHVYMLRKALGQKGRDHVFIETIPKTGYRFVAEVMEIIAQDGDDPSGAAHLSSEPNGYIHDPAKQLPTIHGTGPRFIEEPIQSDNSWRRFLAAAGLVAVCAALVAAVVYFSGFGGRLAGGPKTGSLAVLPFKQISEKKDEKLGLGIADVIIAKLANIEDIAVRPTTSIIRYADQSDTDLFEVGKALNVDYVIEGTIQRENGKVRVTSQLYSVAEKKQVWTETFDEEYKDIFTLQDAISERIAQKVAIGLITTAREFPFKQYTEDQEAYTAYSTGLSYWSQHSSVGFQSAIVHFEKAIEKDPHFALAYAYLADTYAHYQFLGEVAPKEKALRLGEEMADKALMLDPECAEGLAAKALVLATRNRGGEAFRLMRRSLEIKPNDAHARHRIAWMYANRGDLETAVGEMRKALELDPQSTYLNLYLAHFLYLKRDAEGSRNYCKKALSIDPSAGEARWRMLQIDEMEGQVARVESELKAAISRNNRSISVKLFLSRVLAKKGDEKGSKKLLDGVLMDGNEQGGELLASMAFAALGEKEQAMKKLEEAVENDSVELFVLRFAPNLDPLRSDPRFGAIIKDMEVSEGWFEGRSG